MSSEDGCASGEDALKYINSNNVKNRKLKIIAKPNSPKTEITGYSKSKDALKVSIAAPADKDKANREIVKFFSRLLKNKVVIAHGLKSREKILKIL